MIKVVAKTLVREGRVDSYKSLAGELVAETRKESGNISYTLNQDIKNNRLYAMIEAWEDQKSLDQHMASEHFRRIVPQLAEMAEENYPIEIYTEV